MKAREHLVSIEKESESKISTHILLEENSS